VISRDEINEVPPRYAGWLLMFVAFYLRNQIDRCVERGWKYVIPFLMTIYYFSCCKIEGKNIFISGNNQGFSRHQSFFVWLNF
jgi:hypothetical protein